VLIRHCEERCDEAIQSFCADPLARDDGIGA
jgi:hypothetical protein